jgi:hypothetical protein
MFIFRAGAKIVEEYKKVISEGHSENCPWRNKGCDGTHALKTRLTHTH